ncbi:hypothetical protein KUTeg_015551 [Tegillarca granosa]|uniref:Homeobox domain-containing protein n=1 Tax=Tegillarca granosa TaxID=220873 RepID=A0ABQ9EV57_TEGGR|nr:hypothetical protein KUTeg_015551 [Tegillarca granosa]
MQKIIEDVNLQVKEVNKNSPDVWLNNVVYSNINNLLAVCDISDIMCHMKMAVNIKAEPLGRASPVPIPGVNAMDDDKQYMRQKMLKREKSEASDVDASIQNLMEYREAPSSPGASSVHSLNMDNCGSPKSPSSPTPVVQPQEMDDERLPNELLDEICEDIGMKEGMELDFVEFLMEQDMVDPQVYMTPEAIQNTFTSIASNSSSQQRTVSSTTKPGTSESVSWPGRTCGSPSTTYSVASSTNCTVATSSGSSSPAGPASKRFHASTSGPTSPVRINPPPLSPHGGIFKAPQTPPTPRRPSSTSQSIASPSISSTQGPQHSPIPKRCQSPQTTQSVPSSPSQKHFPQVNQISQSSGSCPQPNQSAPMKQMATNGRQQGNGFQGYHRLGRPVPPNVNVQNMQHQPQKWHMSQNNGMINNNQSCALNSNNNMGYMSQGQQQQYGRPIESPLESGYFSNDTASVRSYGSSAPSTVPSSVSSGVASVSTVHNQTQLPQCRQQQQGLQPNHQAVQKSVHFADHSAVPGDNSVLQRQRSNDGSLGGYPAPAYTDTTNIPDCDLENEFNQRTVPSKILPRLTHNMKSEIAPYTVPNNGQMAMSPYGDYARGNNSRPGSGDNNMVDSMQQFDYPQKPEDVVFGVDNNQNSMHMNNFNSSNLTDNGYPSCSVGPSVGMQPQFNQQNHCRMQQPDSSRGQMYGTMQPNDQYKQNGNMVNMPDFCDTNEFQQTMTNMNNSCGMVGMNPQVPPKMMGNSQMNPAGMMGQNCNPQADFQGNNYCQQPVQNAFTNVPRSMHMPAGQDNMSCGGYEQNLYNVNRIDSANMNNTGYPPNPNVSAPNMPQTPATPQGWGGGGSMPQTPQPHPGVHPKMPHQPGMSGMPQGGMQTPVQNPMQPGTTPMPPCTIPNCQSCKNGSPHRPPMLASQQTFIQHLITDRSFAFRSHPLFPLLRDLIIADMNFSSPSFPYQLISNLPAEFDKLLQNFLHRNPPSGNYQKKIRSRQEQDKHTKSTSKSLSAIEEFCEKFDRSVRNSIIKPATFQVPNQGNVVTSTSMGGPPMGGGNMTPTMGTPSKDHKFAALDGMMMPGGIFASPAAKKSLDLPSFAMSPQFKSLKDLSDCNDAGSIVSSSSNHGNKSESKKHPSLPKEAVAIMLDWLRQHKDNPYPNDDEKAMLIKQTGLTINQINYWFTNARRRILPKWAQQCK